MHPSRSYKKGFTLIEIIVAVSIFVIVMLISITALLSAINTNRKAQALSTVIGNLNLAIETMVRDVRTGHDYALCAASGCVGISLIDKDGISVEYRFETVGNDAYIVKDYTASSPVTEGRITGEDVVITDAEFTILGDGPTDGPERMLIHIKGYAGRGNTQSEFNIQTFAVSRSIDVLEF